MAAFSDKTLKLADSVGEFIQYWGFKKVHGQIWLLTYLANEPIDAQCLIENLKVTKGLISTSIKTLLDYDLIREIPLGDNRSKFYQANPDFILVIVNVLKSRELKLIENTKILFNEAKNATDPLVDQKKLKGLSSLLKLGDVLVKGIIGLKKIDLSFWKK